jgi:hypothetical protein
VSDPSAVAPDRRFARAAHDALNPAGRGTVRGIMLYGVFLTGFVGTLAFFTFIDVYDRHFLRYDHGGIYNAFRVVFMIYLFWLVSFAGWRTLVLVAGRRPLADVPLYERLALGFFVGAALLTAAMLVLGYLSLYWRVVAALIAVAIVAVSYRDFAAAVGEAREGIARFVRDNSTFGVIASAAMALLAVSAGAVLLLVKGLYPQGGHDYYQHYSQFYALVIDNHGIWPNDFWYHYYYSKGMGLMFLGMLLSDPLAPALVTFCFVVATALALYSLVARVCPRTLWPWVAVLLYFALNVHTLGTGFYAANGGWGHFQKPHEINAPFLIAILWTSVNAVRSSGDVRRVWWLAAAACCFIVAYILIVSSAIAGLFCLLAATGFFFVRRGTAAAFFGLAVAAGAGLVSVLVLNYVTTGMPSDIGVNAWWPIIDFRQLRDAGTLFDVTNTAFRRAQAVASGVSFSGFSMLDFIENAARFDILGPFLYGALAGGLIWAAGRAVLYLRPRLAGRVVALSASNAAAGGVVLAGLLAVSLFTVAVGPGEPVSYVRVSSFALPLLVGVAAMVWQFAIVSVDWPRSVRALLGYVAPVALAWPTLAQAYATQKPTLLPVLANAVRFVGGQYSIYDGYRDQAGWPALPDATAIYPGMYEAWKAVGPGHRIWSFNVHSYCMVPGCRVESHLSSKMSVHRMEILFGNALEAKAALQRDGLNYFFISTHLDIRDPLICTPLFSPDTIGDHLGVKWTDGTDALLTWKGPGVEPLSADWVAKYRADIGATGYAPSCAGNGPDFSSLGRRIYEEVAKGKRWGWEIERPR